MLTGTADVIPQFCDFQRGNGWWARKGDSRRGTSTTRWLKRGQVVKIDRLSDKRVR